MAWRDIFLAYTAESPAFPMVLLGNKADCSATERQVQAIKAQQWCKNTAAMAAAEGGAAGYGIPYFEVSARNGDKVHEAFREFTRLALEHQSAKQKLKMYNYDNREGDGEEDRDLGLIGLKQGYSKDKSNGGCACYYN